MNDDRCTMPFPSRTALIQRNTAGYVPFYVSNNPLRSSFLISPFPFFLLPSYFLLLTSYFLLLPSSFFHSPPVSRAICRRGGPRGYGRALPFRGPRYNGLEVGNAGTTDTTHPSGGSTIRPWMADVAGGRGRGVVFETQGHGQELESRQWCRRSVNGGVEQRRQGRGYL